MKFILRLLSIVLFVGGVLFAFVGAVHDGPFGRFTASKSPYSAQIKQVNKHLAPVVREMKKACYDRGSWLRKNEVCKYSKNGLLVFKQAGVALIVLSVLLNILIAVFSGPRRRAKPMPAKKRTIKLPSQQAAAEPAAAESQSEVGEHGIPAAAAESHSPQSEVETHSTPAAAADVDTATGDAEQEADAQPAEMVASEAAKPSDSSSPVIDESELEALEKQLTPEVSQQVTNVHVDEELDGFIVPARLRKGDFEDEKFFHDISKVVALAQSNIEKDAFIVGVTVLRPEFLPYLDQFDDKVRDRIGRQMMQYHAMRLKRAEKKISPRQFANQDQRMTEADRETVCRRFMPKNVKSVPEKERHQIGKVYVITDQYRVQQETSSGADDWQDISLRTLDSVMKLPLPTLK